MKETTFEFDIRRTSSGLPQAVERLVTELQSIDGVQSVSVEDHSLFETIKVRAQFDGSDHAQRIHRKIMRIFRHAAEVALMETRSNPSEIFD